MDKDVVKDLGLSHSQKEETSETIYQKSLENNQNVTSIQEVQSRQDKGKLINLDELMIDKNGYVQTLKRELKVSIDADTGKAVLCIIDKSSVEEKVLSSKQLLGSDQLVEASESMMFRANTGS